MPSASVNTIVTSPPYFGLRDYGHAGQMGLEPTPGEFVQALVAVLREAKRVLRDDGTLWLNLGDSYARAGGWSNNNGLDGVKRGEGNRARSNVSKDGAKSQKLAKGLKQKDLIGIPWRVAFALQEDGWYLRQDIIWSKPNPMPESAKDRCTRAHEYIFLLTKSPRYYFNAEAIKEKETCGRKRGPALHADAISTNGNAGLARRESTGRRNKRSVWTVTPKPFKGAHFATFPPDLIEPCILAGSPEGGIVLDPFGGAGTTGLVSVKEGRTAWLIELNPDYAEIAADRIGGDVSINDYWHLV